MYSDWILVLEGLTDDSLGDELVYSNSNWEEFRTPIRDVLKHVITHSAYHRGQAAAAIREEGGKPFVTDYSVYVRKTKG